MGIIETELQGALSPAVKRKRNSTRKLRSTAKRITAGFTEVMVKVTGFGKGAGHVKAHLEYITRNGKLEIETDRGEVYAGKQQIKDFFSDWEKDLGDGRRRKNQRDTMHLVLSMPETTDPESVKSAVREFAKVQFGKNHEYAFALHTDEPHPHCHLTVKCLGFDGIRLNPRKADLQYWREGFAEKLRDQGVGAEATARRSRGVVRKAELNVIRHIEQGDKTHAPRVSKVRAAKIKEVAQELTAEVQGLPVAEKPWEEAIKARQRDVRRSWLAAAAELDRENSKLTFNRKEVRNEPPNYDGISSERARPGQRAAAVYQSYLEKTGRQAPAGALTSVRNLSSIPVVHNEPAAQVFLQPNALDRMGWGGGTHTDMRRAGAGLAGTLEHEGKLTDYQGTMKDNKALAKRIRGFVDAMPAIDTEWRRLKQNLSRQFAVQVDKSQDQRRGQGTSNRDLPPDRRDRDI